MNSWATTIQQGPADSRKTEKRHTPISAVTADKAAVMRSTGRLTYSAGWSSKKAITFDAAL